MVVELTRKHGPAATTRHSRTTSQPEMRSGGNGCSERCGGEGAVGGPGAGARSTFPASFDPSRPRFTSPSTTAWPAAHMILRQHATLRATAGCGTRAMASATAMPAEAIRSTLAPDMRASPR